MGNLSNVLIDIVTDQQDSSNPAADRVIGMALTGVATNDVALNTPFVIFSLKEAEDLGLNSDYDEDNDLDVYRQIKEFYGQAGKGKELWLTILPNTLNLEDACDVANNYVVKLLNAAQGRITHWGISRIPDDEWSPTHDDGLDDDVVAAVLKADALCEQFATDFKPCRAIIGGIDFQGDYASLANFAANTNRRTMVLIGSTSATLPTPCIGLFLGRVARFTVNRRVSRVKSGDLGLTQAYFTNGQPVSTMESAWDALAGKAVVFFRTFANRNGFYFTKPRMTCPVNDKFAYLERGSCVDKAHRILAANMTFELDDDFETLVGGKLPPAMINAFQQKVENAVGREMVPDEISAITAVVDPDQNVNDTDRIKFTKASIRMRGYVGEIEIPLGIDI